jgi:RimJ/RimL family protein N-acetyltransferase
MRRAAFAVNAALGAGNATWRSDSLRSLPRPSLFSQSGVVRIAVVVPAVECPHVPGVQESAEPKPVCLEGSRSLGREGSAVTADESVRLRPVQPDDLPRMYDLQLDPESNRLAVTIPRTLEAFDAHWAKALDDPGNTTRAVLVGEALVGYISCFPMDGQDHVGYWIDRAYWGMGIASRALQLLLREVAKRPLVATAATSNGASIRVLQKCGFVVEEVRLSPASDRYPECEEAVLVLR